MMGNGDPQLGRKLLKNFLQKLADSDVRVDAVGCVNAAVLLTSEGSEVIDSLKKLEQKGAQIATCGTCLDHLNLQDKLQIGGVGTMEQSVQVMATAERIIRV